MVVKSNVLPDLQHIFTDQKLAFKCLLNLNDALLRQYDLGLMDRAKLYAIAKIRPNNLLNDGSIRDLKHRRSRAISLNNQ